MYTIPSLEWLVLVKISVTLWKLPESTYAASTFSLPPERSSFKHMKSVWEEVEQVVVVKVSSLPLPAVLQRKMLFFISAIGWEILMWMLHVREITGRITWSAEDIKKICFHFIGVVDKTKTAETFIENSDYESSERITLAMVYCLEGHINSLWKEVTDDRVLKIKNTSLVSYWFLRRQRESLCRLPIPNIYDPVEVSNLASMFKKNVIYTPKETAFYFWEKLISEENNQENIRKILLESTLKLLPFLSNELYRTSIETYHWEVLPSLLSKMNNETRDLVSKFDPCTILRSFLYWPRQNLFMDMVHRVRNKLCREDCLSTLIAILKKITQGYKDYDYNVLFTEFWEKISIDVRRFVARKFIKKKLLRKLFKIMQTDIIKLVLEEAPSEERRKIFFSSEGKKLSRKLQEEGKDDLLQLFINQCMQSQPSPNSEEPSHT